MARLAAQVPVLLLLALGSSASPRGQAYPAPVLDRPGLSGQRVDLRALHGHVVLLNFWASWCAPCLAEMPVFSTWQVDRQLSGLNVVGVAMDDDPAPARGVATKLRLTYPVVMGDVSLARAYGGVLGLPVTFLIDRGGRIRKRYDGAADLVTMRRDILQLLH